MADGSQYYLTREEPSDRSAVRHGTGDRWDLVIGLSAVLVGLTLLIAGPALGLLVPLVAVVLLLVGVLVFAHVLPGARATATAMVVLGVMLLGTLLALPALLAEVLFVVVGLALVVFGIVRVF